MKFDTVMKSTLMGLVAGTALLLSACETISPPKMNNPAPRGEVSSYFLFSFAASGEE